MCFRFLSLDSSFVCCVRSFVFNVQFSLSILFQSSSSASSSFASSSCCNVLWLLGCRFVWCLCPCFFVHRPSTRISMRHHLVWALVNVLPGSRRRHHYWPDCVCVHNICSNIHQPTIHRIPCHWHSNIFPSSPSLFASHCFVYCVNCVCVCLCLFVPCPSASTLLVLSCLLDVFGCQPNGIGDLFDMLLPMLSIYQEYVRNHHFSLQVLAECKQREKFVSMLRRLEDKPIIQGKSPSVHPFDQQAKMLGNFVCTPLVCSQSNQTETRRQ